MGGSVITAGVTPVRAVQTQELRTGVSAVPPVIGQPAPSFSEAIAAWPLAAAVAAVLVVAAVVGAAGRCTRHGFCGCCRRARRIGSTWAMAAHPGWPRTGTPTAALAAPAGVAVSDREWRGVCVVDGRCRWAER